MQSFTAIPPWPQSIILPAVLALGSTVLAWLLYQRWQEVEEERDRDPGLRQLFNLKWLPLISLSVAITSIVIAILIGVDSRDGDKAWFIIGACYLQIGFSACLLYEGSTAMINKTNFLSSWRAWARRLLQPSYGALPTSILSCILVITKATKIRETTAAFLILICVFDTCDAARVLLAMKDKIMERYEEKPEDREVDKIWRKIKTAASWLRNGLSEEYWRLFSFIIIRNWVALAISASGGMVFLLGSRASQPWILQAAAIPGLLSSLVWVIRPSGHQVSGVGRKPISSQTELVKGEP